MNLYDLAVQYKKIQEYADDSLDNDEVTEDDLEVLIDTIDSVQDSLENKLENTVKLMKSWEYSIEALKKEEERLAKKRKVLENRQKGLKSYAQSALENNKIEKLKAGLFKVRLQKNPPSINILDSNKVPNTYKIAQEPKIDSKKLLNDVKNGTVIEGVELVTDKQHLRIS